MEHRNLDRGCPGDLRQFLAFSSALTAAHPRAKITLAHFKISPSRTLNRRQVLRTIARIKREHGILRGHPMRLIEHDKGDRPPHFHLLFSAVDPATGRVLSSKDNYARDELVSRRLEIAFGEAITPGPRVERNAADLRARGHTHEALILERHAPVRRRGHDSEADRQQGARTKLPPAEFRKRLITAVARGVKSGSLPRALAEHGFSVALGSHQATLMAVHDQTGMALPLLASIAIASRGRFELNPSDAEELRRHAPPLSKARGEGAARTLKRANRQLDREIDRGRLEAAIDSEFNDVFSRMRRERKKIEAAGLASSLSQAAQRVAALAMRRQAVRIRQLRIERAFRTARILQSRRARRIAFAMAAGGMLLTGSGLIVALGAGVVTTAALRGYSQSLRAQAHTLINRRQTVVAPLRDWPRRAIDDASSMEKPWEQAAVPSKPLRAPSAATDEGRPAAGIDFTTIKKADRILAAMALEALVGRPVPIARGVLERVLGPEAFAGLASLAENGSPKQIKRARSWDAGRSSDAFAAEGALRRAGEMDAAKVMARIGRQRVVTERSRARGRD